MARRHYGGYHRHRYRRARSGGIGLLVIAALIGGFFLLRANPALAAKLPAEVRKAIDSVKLPTEIPSIQIPTSLPQLPLAGTGMPQSPSGPSNFGGQTKTSGCQAVN